MEGLTAEEQARITALGAPLDASANIDWTHGQKFKKISRRTWTTKSPELRLARARLDLLNAGFEEDARLLTQTRMNTAWQKLSHEERGELIAERSAGAAAEAPSKKQRMRKKDGRKFRSARFFFFFLGAQPDVCVHFLRSQPMPT